LVLTAGDGAGQDDHVRVGLLNHVHGLDRALQGVDVFGAQPGQVGDPQATAPAGDANPHEADAG